MLKQLLPPSRNPQPHYSFMRPGDFGMFIFLIAMTAFRFQSAYSLELSGLRQISWFGGAVLSLLCLIWFTWLRRKRRHLCDDSGELMIALFAPMTFTTICDHLADGILHRGWLFDSGLLLLLVFYGYRIWTVPRLARDLEARLAACETKDFTERGGL